MAATIFAHVTPKSIKVTEKYAYTVNISRNLNVNLHSQSDKQPIGQIEITVPYDGERYFTEEQRELIELHQPTIWEQTNASVCIGYLGFSQYDGTDLAASLDLGLENDTIALDLPLHHVNLPAAQDLLQDRHACKFAQQYQPQPPRVIPIGIEVNVFDENGLSALNGDNLWALLDDEPPQIHGDIVSVEADVMEAIQRQEGFARRLYFDFQLNLFLAHPIGLANDPKPPTLERIALQWPTPLSRYRLSMKLDNEEDGEKPVLYDPDRGMIEWTKIPLIPPKQADVGTGGFVYEAPRMRLSVMQPGELYRVSSLSGSAQFKVARALSGLQLDYFDATGKRSGTNVAIETQITLDFTLDLDDRFTSRIYTPYQSLQFEGVLLDRSRVADVQNVLRDLGFQARSAKVGADSDRTASFLVVGRRQQGAEELWLWLLLEGRLVKTQRQRAIPGNQVFTTVLDAGHLTIRMRGKYSGDYEEMIRRMNEVQLHLKHLFQHVSTID